MAQRFTAYWSTERNQILVSVSLEGEEAVSDQNIDFENVENDIFENMFEMVNMRRCWMYWEMSWRGQWWCYKTSAKTEPFQATKIRLFYSSVIVTLISGEFYIIVTGRYPSMLDIDPCRLRPEYVIMIGI